jgi:16S rRNA C967 or C1407 C5-methylase (RsmB/RsmF family)
VSSTVSEKGYRTYTAEQVDCLKAALSMQHVKLIMYTTCSSLRCENWDVVHTALSNIRAEEDARKSYILQDILAVSDMYNALLNQSNVLDACIIALEIDPACLITFFIFNPPTDIKIYRRNRFGTSVTCPLRW